MTEVPNVAWDAYAATEPQRRVTNASGERTWCDWTRYPDHGPGAELLSLPPGGRVLDPGCGSGGNLAHLATLGMEAVGVDLSPARLREAPERWPDVEGMSPHCGDALAFLAVQEPFDAVYSVFGAAYLTDPHTMLPAVHARLRPGGVFAQSQRPAVEGCYGCRASYIPRGPGEEPAVARRWDHAPDEWGRMLRHPAPTRQRQDRHPAGAGAPGGEPGPRGRRAGERAAVAVPGLHLTSRDAALWGP
ncbi:class I SAM-dependent methyltransferase [Streptomyces triticirhizae]|uniref:class I SAM-dependent methyltransferase n=1 Tax=Streptomyces triticirhizae TaxID=2483353 RepID=UPI001F1C9AEF|nr:class I SAM-dependent methyltransferase [Streptomyces triticirhizae]